MSSNTSISDDQADRSIDTEYFTASSGSSITEDDTSNDIKGVVIIWNREIIPYDGSGEVIKKKCTSCEQNIDDSITIDNKEAVPKEEVLFNSATLSMIVAYLSSVDLPSLALTCKRFGLPEEGQLSLIELLHDEALFKQPPPNEDCPICMDRLPTLELGSSYMECCGKLMCSGCFYSSIHDNQGNAVDNPKCPFCRAPHPLNDDEFIKRLKKRMEANDPIAVYKLGSYYRDGKFGLQQDYTKALEQYHRAAELGYAKAYDNIGIAYDTGHGVEVDKKKARHYYELAAMGGDVKARWYLGAMEYRVDRALKHYLIAVRDGDVDSLKCIKRLYSDGHVPKYDYTKALRLHQEYLDEIKSTRRDEAAAANDKYRYYY